MPRPSWYPKEKYFLVMRYQVIGDGFVANNEWWWHSYGAGVGKWEKKIASVISDGVLSATNPFQFKKICEYNGWKVSMINKRFISAGEMAFCMSLNVF